MSLSSDTDWRCPSVRSSDALVSHDGADGVSRLRHVKRSSAESSRARYVRGIRNWSPTNAAMNTPDRRRALGLGCAGGGSVSEEAITSTSVPRVALSKEAGSGVRRGGARGRPKTGRNAVLARVRQVNPVRSRDRIGASNAEPVEVATAAPEDLAHGTPQK